jgi:flagellar hook assembly protein FlgD
VRTDVPTVATQPHAVTLLAASPNPFTQGTTLRYRLPERQEAALRIYSVDGRLVSTLVEGVAEAGWHDARWDGRDMAGRDVASGLYFARLETGKEVTIGKLMVLR